MSNDSTAEQVEIRRRGRQRLIGSVALALLAVVFIPMLLDPEPRQQRVEPLVAIPPREGAAPLAPAADAPQAPPAPAAPAGTGEGPKTAQVTARDERKSVEPKAAEFKAPAAARPAPATKPAAAAPRLEGFAVQVGAFREDEKLAQAREKLAAARLPHYTERLQTGSGELTRLRAGPFPTREAADKAAAAMKLAGLEGRVVPLP